MKSYRLTKIPAVAVVSTLLMMMGCNGISDQPGSANQDSQAAQHLPFSGNQALVVPKGTPIYIRLNRTSLCSTAGDGSIETNINRGPFGNYESLIAGKWQVLGRLTILIRRSRLVTDSIATHHHKQC